MESLSSIFAATDLVGIRTTLEPFVALALYIVISGVGISAVTQILKDGRIPVPAERYPRATAAVGSFIATLISLYAGDVNLLLQGWVSYVGLGLVILLSSAFSYNILFRGLSPTGSPNKLKRPLPR